MIDPDLKGSTYMGRQTSQKTWKQSFPHRIHVLGEVRGAAREEAPHPYVRVGFLSIGVLALEGKGESVLTGGKGPGMERTFQTQGRAPKKLRGQRDHFVFCS